MKTILLLFSGMLLGINTTSAIDNYTESNDDFDKSKHYRLAEPISFVERGIEFFIFPDGSFDFNTQFIDHYYNNSRRNTINASYNGPRVSINYSSSHRPGTYISRDRNGTIRSIGNVFLNYDRYGKITRVGSVFIDYGRGRNATLTQVGGLRVNYNRWGEIASIRGFVNQENRFIAYNNIREHNEYANNYGHYDNDDNYYYYKSNGEVKKQKKR